MEIKRLTVRLPEEVHEWLTVQANKKASTVTGEIVDILRHAMTQDEHGFATPEEVRQIAREVARQIVREELAANAPKSS